MASWSSNYDIAFEGPEKEFQKFNRVIVEKLKVLKKVGILKEGWSSETWDWLEQYDSKTHKIYAYERPLSDTWEMEKYLKELMEQFPSIGVSGEVSLFCMTSGEGPWLYQLCSECGSKIFSMRLKEDKKCEMELLFQNVSLVYTDRDGRIERIERVHVGDTVQIVHVPKEQLPVIVQNEEGSLGYLANGSYELATEMKKRKVKQINGTITRVVPLSERKKASKRARTAIVEVRLDIDWND